MKFCYPVLFAIMMCMPFAALCGVIKGTIKDDKGVPLAFATVYVQGTTIGTSAGNKGDYQLSLQPGTYKVICQFVGYKQSSYNLTIKDNETIEHNFVLADQSLMMSEVVIKSNGEDPAYPIMRKTIARRDFHLKQVKSFQTGIYLKGAMRTRKVPKKVMGQKVDKNDIGVDSTGKGVVYLVEEFADYYSEEPNKQRTVIHSVRESGNPGGVGFAQLPPVITFYENNINLFSNLNPRGFISPVSDNALFYYRYKLEGEFTEEGHTIYKIKVTAKRQYEPLFNGTLYIVKDDWAIHSLKMELTKKANLALLDTLRLEQVFIPLKTDNWVVKSQLMYIAVNFFGFDATGGFATVYDRQKVNEPIPDSIFKNKIVSVYDKSANKKDTAFWTEARPIQLEADELKDYKIKDSITRKQEEPAYLDSLRRKRNKVKLSSFLLDGVYLTGKNKVTFGTNALLTMTNYNTVEGYNFAPRLSFSKMIDTGRFISVVTAARYGLANTHLNGIGKITYTYRDRKWHGRGGNMGLEGGKYVFQYNAENPVLPFFNTFSTLFWGENDLKIYEKNTLKAFYYRNYGNGLRWSVKGGFEERFPLQNTTDYTVLKHVAEPFSDNYPAALHAFPWEHHNAVLLHGTLSYQPGYTYVQYPDYKTSQGSNWPVFSLIYDKGIPNILNSKVDYDKWRVTITDDVRLRMLGSLSYRVAAGGFLNDKYVALPDLTHLYGNRGIGLASPYLNSFQFAPYYVFSNTHRLYGEVHVEYYMKGLLTNKIPLFRQARWYFLLGTNTFYVDDNHYYAEGFIGIDNLGLKNVRFLRVDFVQSWDNFMGRNSGIRFGLNLPGAKISFSNSSDEW